MAGITRTDSIIADSTISLSSPPPATSEARLDLTTSEESNKSTRVLRTYGRPKQVTNNEDIFSTTPNLRELVLKTAPVDTEDQIIPDSEPVASPKFVYEWQAKLRAIDDGHSISDINENLRNPNKDRSPPQISVRKLFDRPLSYLSSESTQSTQRPDTFSRKGKEKDSLQGPPHSVSPSVSPSPFTKRDQFNASAASESDGTSPQASFMLNTPDERSFDTPPTSPVGNSGLQNVDDSGPESQEQKSSDKVNFMTQQAAEKSRRPKRLKALTRREIAEMKKESARLLAGQHISVQQLQSRPVHTIASLFDKLKTSSTTVLHDSSDPIASFSSPSSISMPSISHTEPGHAASIVEPQLSSSRRVLLHEPVEQTKMSSSMENDEEMPDLNAILYEDETKRTEKEKELAEMERKAKELEERKMKALKTVSLYDSGDDDLEVEELVIKGRRLQNKGRKSSLPSGIEHSVTGRKSPDLDNKSLISAAKPTFLRRNPGMYKQVQERLVTQEALNRTLLHRVGKQNNDIEEKKKREWVRAGGLLRDATTAEAGSSMQIWLQKGLERRGPVTESEGSDNGDFDYDPAAEGGDELEEPGDIPNSDHETEFDETKSTMEDIVFSDEDGDKENYRPAVKKRQFRAIMQSDEEDEPLPTQLSSHFSLLSDVEDLPEKDKENSAMLAFSVDEDKENDPVPRHRERGRITMEEEATDLASKQGLQGDTMKQRTPLSRLDSDSDSDSPIVLPVSRKRVASTDTRVLQVLHEEDKEATMTPLSPSQQDARTISATASPEYKSQSTYPIRDSIIGNDVRQDSTVGFAPRSVLGKRGFSQLFLEDRSPSKEAGKPLFQIGPHLLQSHRNVQFEFTQPNGLLPSVQISATQRREVDEMFGKDQEFKLDEMRRQKEDNLTANKTNMTVPYFGSFVASQTSESSPQSIRYPLETLSIDPKNHEADSEDDSNPRRRIVRERPESPKSPPPRNLAANNAFDVLREGVLREQKLHGPLKKSEFVEAEAQESDDELLPGFGRVCEDDEEGEDEPHDAVVANLVDDTVVDENHEKILEKHLEHKAADDAALEKLHKDATEGRLRVKRRGGDFFSDSESSEDEGLNKRNKKMLKKRRIDGDNLDACEQNPETRAFYQEYVKPLVDDDDKDLEFLNVASSQEPGEEEVEEVEEGVGKNVESITHADISRLVREMNDHQTSVPEPDFSNVDWVENDQDMMDMLQIQVQTGPLQRRTMAANPQPRFEDDFQVKRQSEIEKSRLKAWASHESQTHTATSRGGFSRKDARRGPNGADKHHLRTTSINASQPKPPVLNKTGSSLISYVEKRKGFDV